MKIPHRSKPTKGGYREHLRRTFNRGRDLRQLQLAKEEKLAKKPAKGGPECPK